MGYQIYPEPVYVDNRPEAWPGGFWRTEYYPALGNDWEKILERRQFNTIIVSIHGVGERFTKARTAGNDWVLLHIDEMSGIWVRNVAKNADIIQKHAWTPQHTDAWVAEIDALIDSLPELPWWKRSQEADRALFSTMSLFFIGEGKRTWPLIWKLHQMFPDYTNVFTMMRNTIPKDMVPMVLHKYKERALWPLGVKSVMDWANHLIATNQLDEARDVLNRGRLFFPLSKELKQKLHAIEDVEYRRHMGTE